MSLCLRHTHTHTGTETVAAVVIQAFSRYLPEMPDSERQTSCMAKLYWPLRHNNFEGKGLGGHLCRYTLEHPQVHPLIYHSFVWSG